jgi:signal transduction histidine kinase
MRARNYLILMAVAILVPAALIMAAGLTMLLDWERQSRIRAVQEISRNTALAIDRDIAVAEALLRGVVNSESLRDGDFARLHREISAMNGATPWARTLLIGYDGKPLFNTLVPYGTPLPGRAGPWVARAYDTQTTRVSGYFVGATSGRPSVSVDVPVPRALGRRYVVSQTFDARYFAHVFDSKGLGRDWVITLLDADGVSIARNRNAETLVGQRAKPELVRVIRANPSGMLRHVTHDGVDVYSFYTRSALSGWTVAVGVPVPEIEAAARTATLYAALSMLGLMGLAIGIAVFLGQRLSVSLGQARDAAQALASARPLPAPAPTGVREVDMLQGGLVQASRELAGERAARQSLEDEREALLASERAARELAEARSRAKDEFLAMLGHELRNPLAAISGAIAVIDMPGVKPAQADQARVIARRQLRHLTRIVDDLLDVRRILSGKVVLHKARINAGAVLRQCCETKRVVDNGAHAWSVEVADLWLEADATRLEQVFDNLLHNAVKYTPAGGAIAVRAQADGKVAAIEVADNGVGIAADTLPLIFDALVQGPTSIDRAQGGLGLGLALARELTVLHGGSIHAHSDGPGLGCRFTLSFPLAEAACAA